MHSLFDAPLDILKFPLDDLKQLVLDDIDDELVLGYE